MKQLILWLLVLTFIKPTYSQKKELQISIGPSVANTWNPNFSLPIGASFKCRYMFNKQRALAFDATTFKLNPQYNTSVANITIVILKAGALTYIRNSNFLIQADAGICNSNFKGINNGTRTGFAGGLGVGYSIPLNKKNVIDITSNFNYIPQEIEISRGWLILNLAYRINFNSGK
jgi:hypothetical protein